MELLELIQDFVKDTFDISDDILTKELDFTKLECWDSLKYMSYVMEVETRFEVTLERNELIQITSYSGLISVLKGKIIINE